MKYCWLIVASWIFEPLAWSQGLSGEVSTVPYGTLTLTITEANGVGITQPSACVFGIVRQGRPDGAIVAAYPCAAVTTPIPPWGTRTQSFTPPVGSGGILYYFQVDYYDASSTLHTEFFTGMVPLFFGGLTLGGSQPHLGQPMPLTLNMFPYTSAPYVIAASFTTNAGFAVAPNWFISLDLDFLFGLSFPNPDPSLFIGFQGNLASNGHGTATVLIPNLPALICKPINLQAVLLGPAGITQVSNPINFTIMP